jgi:GH43 family beta-xylosidase
MHVRPFLLLLVLALMAGLTAGSSAQSTADDSPPGVLRNPLNPYGGPDPWLVYYEGYYYLATTTGRSELIMSKSETLAGLKTAVPQRIYSETDPSRCCNMWAPEFHLLDGPNGPRWYYYYSAGTSGTLDNQRTHVLESAGTDPMGPYTYKGRVYDPINDVWAIDGSILKLDGKLYFLFSSWVGPNQSMFIASMSNPWTLSSPRVMISQPEYDWEKSGANVNEGPVALYHGDDMFIVYSASYCVTPDYKLGILKYNGGDPLSAAAWDKHPEPVFERADHNGVYGPAHNGFFMSPDGTEYWIVYHANSDDSGGCDDRRTTRVQRFTWDENGMPVFGEPVATTDVIAAPSGDLGVDPIPDFGQLELSRLRAMGYRDGFLSHNDVYAQIAVMPEPDSSSQFYIVPGLADPEAVSIRSITLPGYYLRYEGNLVVFAASDGSETFAADATWRIIPGLADAAWQSLEAYSRPGHVIGQQFGVVALVPVTDSMSQRMREDATFRIE